MRETARQIIIETLTACGLNEASIILKPEKDSILLPSPRAEIEYQEEDIKRKFKKLSVSRSETEETIKVQIYSCELLVSLAIKSKDKQWLSDFVESFLISLKRKQSDMNGNLVIVEAEESKRNGFESAMVDVSLTPKYSNTIDITFHGMITNDISTTLVRNFNLSGIIIN
jgi:hypothetical protein